MNVEGFLGQLKARKGYSDQIVVQHLIPKRNARLATLPKDLAPEMRECLREIGIPELYTHQRSALEATALGQDIVVVTPTASGKTMCYNLRVVNSILTDPTTRALYLFPTKALAQDQLGKLRRLDFGGRIRFATYDGDTPRNERGVIRKTANIVLTNPDMLHLGILPNYEHWLGFLGKLRYVVIDEMHVYRGVFGSHVANVLRRLFRLCEGIGAKPPQVICCSATIGNPLEVAGNLTGRDCTLVSDDGSPHGNRWFVVWNPPIVGDAGERRSANMETTALLAAMVAGEVRTIAFARARVTAELLLRYARGLLAENSPELVDRIESYRGGYTPAERREIERRLFGGELLGVTATNALELGIDVGELDAAILNGFPGSISSLWQQAGRAGRSEQESLALYVAQNDPLEQHLVRNPDLLLDAAHEHAQLNPDNQYVLWQQLRCAAFEKPLATEEVKWFGPAAAESLEALVDAGLLEERYGRHFCPSHESPASDIDIRSASGKRYDLLEAGSLTRLGTVEEDRAFQVAHPGATYLHRGRQYLIESLDVDSRTALARPTDVDFYTDATTETSLDVRATVAERKVGGVTLCMGGVTVSEQVTGFSRRALLTEQFLGYEYLDLPPRSFDTLAVWLAYPQGVHLRGKKAEEEEAALERFGCGLHALEHALLTVLPVLAGCDRADVGSSWYLAHHQSLAPAVFLFDDVPGGVGICESAFERAAEWFESARRSLAECPCVEGCPACLLAPRCGTRNQFLNKAEGLRLLSSLTQPSDG